jgi:dimeric dUTPase (all-alpha-NTP-PPase superfamily)
MTQRCTIRKEHYYRPSDPCSIALIILHVMQLRNYINALQFRLHTYTSHVSCITKVVRTYSMNIPHSWYLRNYINSLHFTTLHAYISHVFFIVKVIWTHSMNIPHSSQLRNYINSLHFTTLHAYASHVSFIMKVAWIFNRNISHEPATILSNDHRHGYRSRVVSTLL